MRDEFDNQRSIAISQLQTGHTTLRIGILQCRQFGIRTKEQGGEPLAWAPLHNLNVLNLCAKRIPIIL